MRVSAKVLWPRLYILKDQGKNQDPPKYLADPPILFWRVLVGGSGSGPSPLRGSAFWPTLVTTSVLTAYRKNVPLQPVKKSNI